jgi:Flp pilus assembly protein TadG
MRCAYRRLAHLRSSEHGGALAELAVVLPLLILIAIGVMDYGRVYSTSIAVANAARAGAEWGSTPIAGYSQNNAAQESFAQMDGAEAGTMTIDAVTVCKCGGSEHTCGTVPSCGTLGAPQVFVTVTATKAVALLLPYPGLPNSITITRSATFRAQ